ncbi:MAG: hypothetical protein V9E87_00310 [Gemmatimonadales bacterium]
MHPISRSSRIVALVAALVGHAASFGLGPDPAAARTRARPTP